MKSGSPRSGSAASPSEPHRAAAFTPTAAATAPPSFAIPAASTLPAPSPAGTRNPCAGTSAKNSPTRNRCFTLDDETGSGTVTALRLWGDVPVFNGAVAFTLDHGTVTAVSGSLLPDTGTAAAEEQPLLSAFAALTAFQQMRHESSSVVSAITEISLCYELQSTAAAPMALVPSWRITTDTASFYVNCVSGTVRRA